MEIVENDCLKLIVFAIVLVVGPGGFRSMLFIFNTVPRPARAIPTELQLTGVQRRQRRRFKAETLR